VDIDQSISKEIQGRLTPQAPLTIPAYEYCGACLSAAEVGGDGYDVLEMKDGRFGFLVADVSGKGLLGSLRMAMTLAEFRLRAEEGKNPALCLAETNEAILPDIKGRRFVSLAFAAVDVYNHRMTLASAGHNPVYLVRAGKVIELKSRGIALGVVPSEKYFTEELIYSLLPEDLLVFYSDGVTEARNGGVDEFGEERLKAYFSKNHSGDLEVIRDGLFDEVSRFVKGAEQHDDMTLLLVRRRVDTKG
jgi:sigma-B regulation protein RsbU (phosphoserine phosphatase)